MVFFVVSKGEQRMHSGGAIPCDAKMLVPDTIWYGYIWAVKVDGEEGHTSHWNSYDQAVIRYDNMLRDKPDCKIHRPKQAPALFVFIDGEVKISPLFDIGF
jgi:hypothetical protein